MSKVLKIEIDPEIKLNEVLTKNMPDNIKGNLLATMTHACKKYNCHWTELTWKVKIMAGQPVIYVNRKK